MNTPNNAYRALRQKTQKSVTMVGLTILAIWLGICFLIGLVLMIKDLNDPDPFRLTRMFEDVSELAFLDEYTAESASKLQDNEIGGLDYTDSYLNTIILEEREYKIYAYDFVDKKVALEYFERVVDYSPSSYDTWEYYTLGSLMGETTLVQFYDCHLLVIKGAPMDEVQALSEWIGTHLSVDLTVIPE